jgi:hypothetical protein
MVFEIGRLLLRVSEALYLLLFALTGKRSAEANRDSKAAASTA